jgi:hypothetical protein
MNIRKPPDKLVTKGLFKNIINENNFNFDHFDILKSACLRTNEIVIHAYQFIRLYIFICKIIIFQK